ncbi:MAG: succinylglutamate desuccinylase/aspartoacylase family protein [Balneola sp.]|nr:succinylglutamate desuccinylase/aspartoacylase family protein [Balneola sp.]MBO6650704.1 succinylglutamate desuccinylase/aspartoacylase family protein [Balneola sp.]MBO6710616.1 succinylglutamate desuccinylase/aspartoacylase family protein [Balneola sp.]MBO6799302.1 succinylglutamate desuccinylase/aspartoacylase family protein [Balneola sp.]MBO6869569.1 succinylglutamate desuccinylase/aspartoacylase family protein [Balneola sp.]
MPDNFLTINKEKIALGENKVINFDIASLPTRTSISLPVHVYRSLHKGPVLLLTGGLHGDELNGVEIIRRMIDSGDVIPDFGSVIAIPIVNIYGFIQNSRGLPDGKDINRSFPGIKKGGSLAKLLAYTLMRNIIPHIDCGVDFHTGGASRSNFPQIRVDLSNEKALEIAKAFQPPIIVNSKPIPKSFRSASFKKGKNILVYETGESSRFDEFGIQEAINGTLRLMNFLGIKKTKLQSQETAIYSRSTWIRSGYAGLFSPSIKLGDRIKKKQLLGHINGAYGELHSRILAPKDGRVIGLNYCPVVNKGDAIIHYSYN